MVAITEALIASRRAFMLGSGALLIAKPKLLVGPLPKLWGDGIHDDTDALNALLSGKPIKAALTSDTFLPLFSGGWAALKGGHFWIEGTVRPTVPFWISHARLSIPSDSKMAFDFSKVPPSRERPNSVFTYNVLERVHKTPDLYETSGNFSISYKAAKSLDPLMDYYAP